MGFRIEIGGTEISDSGIRNSGNSPSLPSLDDVKNTVGRTISQLTNPVRDALADAGDRANRGDIGRWAKGLVEDTARSVTLPFHVVSDIARGDTENAGRNVGRWAGSLGNTMSIGTARAVGESQSVQDFLRTDDAKKYTFGLSEDYAGLARGMNTLRNDAYVSDEDRNSAIRYGAKAALIAGSIAYLSGSSAATQSAAAADSGLVYPSGYLGSAPGATVEAAGSSWWSWGGAGAALGYAKDAALIGAAVKSGRPTDVIEQLVGVDIPDEIEDIINPGSPAGQNGTPGWAGGGGGTTQTGYHSDVTGFPSLQAAAGMSPVVIGVGLIALAIFAAKKGLFR